jgi:hypothetical protein
MGALPPFREALIMRNLLLIALLAGVVGCQGTGLFSGRKKEKPIPAPDPLFTPDLEEQERYGRSRYAYPEGDRTIAPPTYADRPTPSGR